MTHPFDKVLALRFNGLLKRGKHRPDGEACALEAASVARGNEWSDVPAAAGLPDIRPLNDAGWSSDEARTRAMRPLVKALWGWPEWSEKKRVAWARRVALRTVREVLPIALDAAGLRRDAQACRAARTLRSAAAAANAAAAPSGAAAAAYSADAAESAAAARAAAAAAAYARAAAYASPAAADRVLRLACRIMREEAQR